MIITKVKSGKSIKIDYEDGRDKKTLTSKEMAATEFYDALSEIALDIKTSLAKDGVVLTGKPKKSTQIPSFIFWSISSAKCPPLRISETI